MKELNTNSEEISNQGLKIKRIIKVWSNEEDALLAKYHTEFNGNWQLISPQMKGRNVSQCSQRWRRLNPQQVRKQWTTQEDAKARELIQKYGRCWGKIAKKMGTRNGKQLRERFINNLDQNINLEKFTAEEDKIILDQYLKFGPKWSEISKLLVGRPENMVKNRYYSYLKRVNSIVDKSLCEETSSQQTVEDSPLNNKESSKIDQKLIKVETKIEPRSASLSEKSVFQEQIQPSIQSTDPYNIQPIAYVNEFYYPVEEVLLFDQSSGQIKRFLKIISQQPTYCNQKGVVCVNSAIPPLNISNGQLVQTETDAQKSAQNSDKKSHSFQPSKKHIKQEPSLKTL